MEHGIETENICCMLQVRVSPKIEVRLEGLLGI